MHRPRLLLSAMALLAGSWSPEALPGRVELPRHQPRRQFATKNKPSPAQIRRAARKRRNIRARSPMARK